MTKYFCILTDVGAAKLANATALGQTLEFSKMALGDGAGSLPTPNQTQTSLVRELRREALNSVEIDENNPNWIVCEQVLPANVGGWTIREMAIYDTDGDMVAVGNFPETYKPVLEEGSGRTQTIRMVIQVSNAATVTLKIDPSVVLATREYVDKKDKGHVDAPDPHPQYRDASKLNKGVVSLSRLPVSESRVEIADKWLFKTGDALINSRNNGTKGIDEYNATRGSSYAWNYNFINSLKLVSSNNAMSFFVSGIENERAAGIQVGHSDKEYADSLGRMLLNPFGGDVSINGFKALHEGNISDSEKIQEIDYEIEKLNEKKAFVDNDHCELPGGLIIQWVTFKMIDNVYEQAINLPIAFPNKFLSISASHGQSTQSNDIRVRDIWFDGTNMSQFFYSYNTFSDPEPGKVNSIQRVSIIALGF